MAKKPRPPRLEKSCPLVRTHTRLHQVHDLWHRVAADYGDPDQFVTSLNAALTALRTVSFMINKDKHLIPDFEAWYQPHIDERYSDPLMVWLKNARNFVQKEGDLEVHSRARVSVLGGSSEPLQTDIDIDPLLTQEQIALRLAPGLPGVAKRDGLLAVERRWVAATLPDHELLDVLAHGYGVMAEIVADAHRQCGVVMQTFGDEAHKDRPRRREQLGGRLSCMVAHAELRTAYVHLAENRLIAWGGRSREITREDVEGWDPPPGMTEATSPHVPGEPLTETAAGLAEAAKVLVKHVGGHEPMAMVFETRDDAPILCSLNARDHATQTLMMQAVAREVERVRAEGVFFVAELRRPAERDGELIAVVMTDAGQKRTWRTPVIRSRGGSGEGASSDADSVTLGETVCEDGIVPDFMDAVSRSWIAMGRGVPRE
ncbi:MAG: hypothetical protein JWR63_3030 [Conexibacter sp.]|nr:hypothetical protein [Conexibacter sp.]